MTKSFHLACQGSNSCRHYQAHLDSASKYIKQGNSSPLKFTAIPIWAILEVYRRMGIFWLWWCHTTLIYSPNPTFPWWGPWFKMQQDSLDMLWSTGLIFLWLDIAGCVFRNPINFGTFTWPTLPGISIHLHPLLTSRSKAQTPLWGINICSTSILTHISLSGRHVNDAWGQRGGKEERVKRRVTWIGREEREVQPQGGGKSRKREDGKGEDSTTLCGWRSDGIPPAKAWTQSGWAR